MKKLILIGGPTASGKTSLAIDVARYFKTEILSFDSRQLYKEMHIGVAKPSEDELTMVKHHLIGTIPIDEHFNAGTFENQAVEILNDYFQHHDIMVAVGGTGMYADAITQGLDDMPSIPSHIDTEIDNQYEKYGLTWLQTYLLEHDPTYYHAADIHNSRRLIRAVKIIAATGKTFSSFRTGEKKVRNFTPYHFLLNPDRELLNDRINQRVDQMVEHGLITEARLLYPHRALKALHTVGYRELFEYFDGMVTLDQAIENIKTHTRQYAKRQRTWFRNHPEWTTLPYNNNKENTLFIKNYIHDLESKT